MPSAVPRKPKDLQVAESIGQLNEKIPEKNHLLNDRSLSSLVKSFKSLYEHAEKHYLQGDEENAYLFYMRAMEVFHKHLKPKGLKPDKKTGFFLQNCLIKSEELCNSLERRYEILKESKIAREKEQAHNNHNHRDLNGDGVNIGDGKSLLSAKSEQNGVDKSEPGSIQPIELYENIQLIKKASSNDVIIIIDIRKRNHFNESHIELKKLDTPNVKLINIPEEKLEPGMVISKLLRILPVYEQTILKERYAANKVILFDWVSSCLNDSSFLKIMYDCLWKWDTSKDKCVSPPLILENGYNGWLTSFPIFTSSSTVQPPIEKYDTHSQQWNNNANDLYDQFVREFQSASPEANLTKPTENGAHEAEPDISQSNSLITRLTGASLKDAPSKIPGSAQFVPPINRAVKPKLVSGENSTVQLKTSYVNGNTTANDIQPMSESEFKNRKRMEAIDWINKYNMEEAEKNKLDMQYFNNKLEKIIKMLPLETEEVKNDTASPSVNYPLGTSGRAERTASESVDTPSKPPQVAKPGRSLSRSYSSPNIADHAEGEEDGSKDRPATPAFDRSLKPRANDFPRSVAISARSRNFSPVYGIPGQVNTGLKNLGNTCFMNAVLQCLADTIDLREYFLTERHMADINRTSRLGSKGELADELGALIREIRSNQFKSVSPMDFKDAVMTHIPFFVGGEQQDAHEFLCMLLEKLHADLNRAPNDIANGVFTLPDDLPPHIAVNKFWNHHLSRNNSIISGLFEGLLMSTLTCTVCRKQSNTFEVFIALSLPISTRHGHRCTLSNCLDLFTDDERLTGEAGWECPTCKTKRDAIKRIRICKLPRVLVIHLKRFSYEGKSRQKLQNLVEFPLTDLNLDNYRCSVNMGDPGPEYNLYGVINHNGTLEGGHYVAYCKNEERKKWFVYDDHEVTELGAADVKSHAAYLLFYNANH